MHHSQAGGAYNRKWFLSDSLKSSVSIHFMIGHKMCKALP